MRKTANPLRLLLVEDHEPTRFSVSTYLCNRCHAVYEARSADESVSPSAGSATGARRSPWSVPICVIRW